MFLRSGYQAWVLSFLMASNIMVSPSEAKPKDHASWELAAISALKPRFSLIGQ